MSKEPASSDPDRAPDPHRSGGTASISRIGRSAPHRESGSAGPVTVYLGLGSNTGDRRALIDEAVRQIGDILQELRKASLYETAPMEVLDQPRFLNTVVSGSTRLDPYELLERTQRIETSLGRDRSRERRKGPRSLDIDILLYGDLRMSGETLTIPHPSMTERGFVLVPLLELEPDLREPGSGTRYASFLDRLGPQDISGIG